LGAKKLECGDLSPLFVVDRSFAFQTKNIREHKAATSRNAPDIPLNKEGL
jgi:hypothetical protein